jgi:hypothetical protein
VKVTVVAAVPAAPVAATPAVSSKRALRIFLTMAFTPPASAQIL